MSNEKNLGGRPKQLTPELIEKARGFLATCVDKIDPNHPKGFSVSFPSFEKFALYLGVHRDTLYAWASENPQFSDILGEVKHKQAEKLIEGGLSGAYSHVIAKLLLSKHDYRDQVDSDVTTGGEKLTFLPAELMKKHGIGNSSSSGAESDSAG